ncbi:MAG TPA: hypothetical protein VK967_05385 [Methylotenera sp.]|nr:hypothetical protein [Methylotenera sp.]
MKPNTFRCLVILSFVFSIIAGLVDSFYPSLLPEPLSQAYENLPLPSALESPVWLVIFGSWLLLGLAGMVGLIFFKNWARFLSLYTTILSFFLLPLLGPGLASGWAAAFYNASFIMWGAVLAVAYYSPLADRFNAK